MVGDYLAVFNGEVVEVKQVFLTELVMVDNERLFLFYIDQIILGIR